jgi:hypothetical protein|tara:strand:- start:275 stop:880 length:606 start_codon:yes stop_codon:yes gene_type:complete
MSKTIIAAAMADTKLPKLVAQVGSTTTQSSKFKAELYHHVYHVLKMQDMMYFVSPKSAGSLATKEWFDYLKGLYHASYPKAAQEMLVTPAKDLRQTENPVSPYLAKTTSNKTRWITETGAMIGDLKNRVGRASGQTGNKAESTTQSRVFGSITDLIRHLTGWEDMPDGLHIDLPEVIADLKKMQSSLNTCYKFVKKEDLNK